MQNRRPEADAAVQLGAGEPPRRAKRCFRRRQFVLLDQLAAGHKLGNHHRDGLKGFRLFFGIATLGLVLDDEHTETVAAPQDGHAEQRLKYLLPRLRPVSELGMGLRVRQGKRAGVGSDIANQPFANPQTRAVHRVFAQPFRREKFQDIAWTLDIDGADFRHHAAGDELDDAVEAFLCRAVSRHGVPQLAQQAPRSYPASLIGHFR